MEQLEKNQAALIEDIDSVKGNVKEMKAEAAKLEANEGLIPPPAHIGMPRPTKIHIPHENHIDWNLQYEDEDPKPANSENKLVVHPTNIIGEPRTDHKYKIMEEMLRDVKGFNIFRVDVVGICLIQRELVELKPLASPPIPPPRGYNTNAICDSHTGSPGHTIEKFLALKFNV
ncbi:hypothetical protein KIW84_043253 [Lathyrus oleraceus]|uniref:Uncharacterized protein n=1 Tax=Pisum sativum TaxID=3888 RepID=A0A9D4XH01_PEA|nr:hypothetical protein KIW84_043253 [Pisum sativum]